MANEGLSVGLVSGWLNAIRGTGATTYTAITTLYVQLHTSNPGAAGTSNVSVGSTTRNAINFNASSGGTALALTAVPSVWTDAATSETINSVTVWSASSAGTFLFSVILTTGQPWVATNTFTLNTLTFSLTPQAAA